MTGLLFKNNFNSISVKSIIIKNELDQPICFSYSLHLSIMSGTEQDVVLSSSDTITSSQDSS